MPQTGHATAVTIRFGPASGARAEFELNIESLDLRRNGQPVALRRQAVRALALLLTREGRVVTSDELRRELWGDQVLDWRSSLHQCIRDLRRALSDDARSPGFVATVARIGYRFVGSRPQRETPGTSSAAPGSYGAKLRGIRRPWVAYVAGLATALLVPASLLMLCVILASPP